MPSTAWAESSDPPDNESDNPSGMISELLAEHYFVINFASIISKSFESPLTINTIINERHVNPIRIVFITKLPNELIKL